jgi:hypothetical protein
VRNEEVQQRFKEDKNILHTKKRRKLTRLVAFCVETAIYNVLLKENKKGGETEEVDVSSYWMALRK